MRGRRYAASVARPWPDVAALPAPGGIRAAAPRSAGQPAAAGQRSVGPDGAAVQQSVGSDAVAVRRSAAPDAAPSPVDGTRARRDGPWPAAPPDEPLQVARLDAQPVPVVPPFHGGLGRTR